jgi:hypothetical protein
VPPLDEGVTGVAGAACTLTVLLALPLAPALSVTVRLTTTLPAALVASVALAALVAPLKAAKLPPLVICHW